MATKTCPIGHQYDSDIFGDDCPFCPSKNALTQEDTLEHRERIDDMGCVYGPPPMYWEDDEGSHGNTPQRPIDDVCPVYGPPSGGLWQKMKDLFT